MKKFTILLLLISTFSYSQSTQSKQDRLYKLHVELGMSLYNEYKTDSLKSMMNSFQTAIDLKPNKPYAFWMRGYIKQELGDLRGAMEDLNTCIQKDPNYIDCFDQRATLKAELEDWRGAALDFERVLELMDKEQIRIFGNIKYEDILYNIATCKLYSGALEEACNLYSKAGELGSFQAYTAIKKHCN